MLVPIIRVRDKHTGREHIVGFDKHDILIAGVSGDLQYYNLQNDDGSHGCYDFVFEDDGYHKCVEMVSVEEAVKLWQKAERLQKENATALRKIFNCMVMS